MGSVKHHTQTLKPNDPSYDVSATAWNEGHDVSGYIESYREQYTKIVGFDAATCDYVCDGVADEVQWNQAIVAVAALGGGTVAGQRGLYNAAATINNSSFVDIQGSGDDTIIKASFAGPVFTCNSINNFKISNLQIDCNSIATYGISLGTCTYWTVSSCNIHHSVTSGILASDCSKLMIISNYFSSCATNLKVLDSFWGAIVANISEHATTLNFYIRVSAFSVCNNTIASNQAGSGVLFETSMRVVCADNIIHFYDTSPTYAIKFITSINNIVKGNTIYIRGATDGIQMECCEYSAIVANAINMISAGGG